jgi:L-rhamnose-H+ transport protein
MGYNPLVGLLYHWIGGLSSATCYLPYKGIKRWAWEVYWLVQGIASWLIAPLLVGLYLVPNALHLLQTTPPHTVSLIYMWGALWGFGALTFGLSVRYLGVALGYAIALGLCTAFGTLVPPLFSGELGVIVHTTSGQVILLGVATCVAGIALSGVAGVLREREMGHAEKKAAVKDFNFRRGIAVATFSGVMSSCFAYGIASGKPLTIATRAILLSHGRFDLWQGLPALTLVMLGGFTTNIIWCFYLLLRNNTLSELWGDVKPGAAQQTDDAAQPVPMLKNYGLSIGGGLLWYFQYFFYTMGQTRMGKYGFASWSLHMASIIIFSTLWGLHFREWKGTSQRTHIMLYLGLVVLIASTLLVGYGSYLKLDGVNS